MNPADLCTSLAAALGNGSVFEHTTVAAIDENEGGCVVKTDTGHRIDAQHVVIATQSPIVDPMLIANRCKPTQSYAIAVRADGNTPDAMYLSADDFTISLRPAVVDGERFLIVGGNGHEMGKAPTAGRWATLERWASEHIGAGEVVRRWATHDLSATDHVPFVGRAAPTSQRRWLATAFGKWGMTNAYVAARIIADGVEQKDPAPWAATFDSTRVRSTTINREFLSAGKNAFEHLVIDRIARRPEPRCTHQGCVLRKDDELNTWDCPCHGSRFDADGTVLQGPAIKAAKTS
jgi:glycine/D-amino acid oxidase-like deaminating enzyme